MANFSSCGVDGLLLTNVSNIETLRATYSSFQHLVQPLFSPAAVELFQSSSNPLAIRNSGSVPVYSHQGDHILAL